MKLTLNTPDLQEVDVPDADFVRELEAPEVGSKADEAILPALFSPCPATCRNHGLAGKVDCGGNAAHRLNANVTAMTALALDFDHMKPGDLERTLAALRGRGLKAFHWTTFSHKPGEDERFRLVLPFDEPMPLTNPQAWSKVAWPALVKSLGLDESVSADRACRDAARLYYMPRRPSEEATWITGGLTNGEPLSWKSVLGASLESFPATASVPAPLPVDQPDLEVATGELEALRKTLASMKSSAAHRLGKGLPPSPAPHLRARGESSRYEAWLQATSSLSMAAEDSVPTEALEDFILRPSWLKEVEESPDDHTAWDIVKGLLASARATAPQRKAERMAADKARSEVALSTWKKARGVPDAPLSGGAVTTPDGDGGVARGPRDAHLTVLDEAFALFRAPDGSERIYSVSSTREAVLMLTESHLEKVVYDFLKEQAESVGERPSLPAVKQAIGIWKKECTPLLSEPEPFAFEDGAVGPSTPLVYKRFTWKPTEGPHPAWDEYLARLTDPGAFKAWVWSLFEPLNRSRQYLWIHGEGQDGKSVVMRVLAGVFGAAATGLSNSHLHDTRFLFSSMWGKRLVIYADCKNSKFGMSEVVRNMTSGDPVLIEFKGQTPFTASLNTKLMIGSNDAPEITSGAADVSRCVYVKVSESQSKDDPKWQPKLEQELPQFLEDCRRTYAELCPHGGNIKLSDESIALRMEAAHEFESEFEEVFERYFVLDPAKDVKGVAMRQALEAAGLKDSHKQRDFKEWMRRSMGIETRRPSGRQGGGRVYVGIGERARGPLGMVAQ